MCTDESDYSLVCGPRRQIESFIENSRQSVIMHRFGIDAPPRLLDLADLYRPFREADSPAIAVVRHREGVGIPFTRQLQVELMVGSSSFGALPELLCEPGYRFYGTQTGTGGGGAGPQVQLDKAALTTINQNLPQGISQAAGRRVALLDTGADPGQVTASGTMVDFTDIYNQGVRSTQPAADAHGHGTGMAQIIHAVNSKAVISPVRVLDASNRGECYEILAGLQYALYSNEFDCVAACLAAPATTTCASSLGRTMEWMLGYTQKLPQVSVPVVVTAAGNGGSGSNSEYLAQMAGVVVAIALDDQGKDASYNSTPPSNAVTQRAYGGTSQKPVGTITQTANTVPLYGTSIAAAAITGAHLP